MAFVSPAPIAGQGVHVVAAAQLLQRFRGVLHYQIDDFFKLGPVSYTHLRAHETRSNLVCRLLLEKIFFNDTATTEIYTRKIVGSVRCV